MPPTSAEAASEAASAVTSFRDPDGCVVVSGERVLRVVSTRGMTLLRDFLESSTAKRHLERGTLVKTSFLAGEEVERTLALASLAGRVGPARCCSVLEHEKIWFPSYPYEWPAEMLHSAAELTLDLAENLLAEGMGLKDGTPYNVLFRGASPVFVDVLSFERRDRTDPVWLAYAQFVRTFLLPLLAAKRFGFRLADLLTQSRDGVEPEMFYRWLSPLGRLRPPLLSLVSLPVWLSTTAARKDNRLYTPQHEGNPEKARYVLERTFAGLRRTLRQAQPRERPVSTWSSYMQSLPSYSAEQLAEKERFVAVVIDACAPRRVLDIGCNNGHFSAMFARGGASVVAIDQDAAVIGDTWRMAVRDNLDILPLLVDITRPSPSLGWNNRECPSFLERARGGFDCVSMLAVLHHLLITERVPLEQIAQLVVGLTERHAIVEFVGPQDPMFRKLLRGRDSLHAGFSRESFEAAFQPHFRIHRSQGLKDADRRLYWLERA